MYIEQALSVKNDWWRYLIGLIVIFIGWQFIGIIPLTVVAFLEAGSLQDFIQSSETNFMSLGINNNLFLVLLIFSFAMGLVGLLFAAKYINQQSVKSLTTSRSNVDWGRIRFSFFLIIGVNLGLFLAGYFSDSEELVWNFKLVPFILLFVIGFLLLPLQTSFEEYLFRGYLMQGLGVLTKNCLLYTSPSPRD